MIVKRLDGGKQILNFDNIDFIKVKLIDEKYKLYYLYRPKIKTEELEIRRQFKDFAELNAFMLSVNLTKLDEYFINVKNISLVDEIEIIKNKIKVIIYLKYNQPLELNMRLEEWNNFKNNSLI